MPRCWRPSGWSRRRHSARARGVRSPPPPRSPAVRPFPCWPWPPGAPAGTGPRAWLWCVEYARRYVSLIGPREGIARFLAYTPQVAAFEAPLWVAAGVGLVLLAARRARPTARPFLLGLLVASLAALSPG